MWLKQRNNFNTTLYSNVHDKIYRINDYFFSNASSL